MRAKTRKRLARLPFYLIMFLFILFVIGIFATVVIGCFSNDWSKTFLPETFSTFYLKQAWTNYGIGGYYLTSIKIVAAATLISLVCAIPASYVMARREMKIKGLLHQFFQLPILLPELLIGIPLATIFYSIGIAESYAAVVAVLIVIGIPFGLSILTPFVESLDERVEIAAETLGADKLTVFTKIIIPQLLPGVVSTLINVFVRLFTNYTLVLLVGGPKTFTLTIKVFNVLSNAKVEPQALLNSLTLYYMLPMLVFTFLTLLMEKKLKKRFGNK